MNKKFALYSGILASLALSLAGAATTQAVAVTTGSNMVSVYSCQQVGKDVKIRRTVGTAEYVLTSTCRNAGHGLRDYTLTCTSNKQYKVEWKNCGTVPTPTPDNDLPVVSVSLYNAHDNGNGYIYSARVVGKDNTSAIRKVRVFMKKQSDANWQLVRTFDYPQGTSLQTVETFDTSVLAYGTNYMFYAEVTDASGKTNTKINPTFATPTQVDTQKPTVTISTGDYHSYKLNNKWYLVPNDVTAVVNDNSGSVKAFRIMRENTSGADVVLKVCSIGKTPITCKVNLMNTPVLTPMYAVAWDYANNMATSTKVALIMN